VKEAYFSILKAEKLLLVAGQTEKQVAEHAEMAKAFYEVGMTPKNDYLEARVELAQVQQDLISAENDLRLAKARFNTVLRRPLDTPVNLEDILGYQEHRQQLDECIALSYAQRPEIREAEKNIEQKKKEAAISKSDFFPDIYLRFSYERLGDDYDVQGTDFRDQENWQLVTTLEWTFWEWGKTYFTLQEEKVGVGQAEDALIQIRDDVALEVKEAYLAVREAEKSIFVAQTAIEQAEENFRMNQARYQEQVATTTDVLDAQTLLTEAKSNYYSALSDYNIAWATLERAMGVGRPDAVRHETRRQGPS
jgi:outer membrane protein TolC